MGGRGESEEIDDWTIDDWTIGRLDDWSWLKN